MITTLRAKSQITIPIQIISQLRLKEGDRLDIYESDGIIHMVPVSVCPKSYVNTLHKEITQLKETIQSGAQPAFENIDAILEKLEKA